MRIALISMVNNYEEKFSLLGDSLLPSLVPQDDVIDPI